MSAHLSASSDDYWGVVDVVDDMRLIINPRKRYALQCLAPFGWDTVAAGLYAVQMYLLVNFDEGELPKGFAENLPDEAIMIEKLRSEKRRS